MVNHPNRSRIPHAGPDAALLGAALAIPDRCGHGKTWDEDCAQCAAVWRKERIGDLVKQAAKYGFELVPVKRGLRDRIDAATKRRG